jgi:HlyD family secretion protein
VTDIATVLPAPRLDTRPVLRAALLASLLLFGVLGAWAALVPVGGAVIAPGRSVAAGKPHPVQTVEGGAVAVLAVKAGDRVAAGDLILTLDPAPVAARLAAATDRLAAALAERARFRAEATGAGGLDATAPDLPFPAPDLTAALATSTALFHARAARAGEMRARAEETAAQVAAQDAGVAAQIAALEAERLLLGEEIANQAALVAEGLARQGPLAELKRQAAQMDGRLAALAAERKGLEATAREAARALAEAEAARAEEAAQGLRDTAAEIGELVPEITALRAAEGRGELRAPVAGVVHELAVAGPGAVVAPGATVAQVIPQDGGVEIEVSVDPRAIDQVHPGQTAEVRIAAFDPMMPRLPATVALVAPDASTDPATGQRFFRVTLRLDPAALKDVPPVSPGMPAEAYLATGERPMLAWLVAPLANHLDRAFREN